MQRNTLVFGSIALVGGVVVLGREWWQATFATRRRRDPDKPWEGIEPEL